jgi:perosamine synthetase
MNFFPKQIIYNINFINFFKKKISIKKTLSKIISLKNKNFFFLGRARSGIYIIVKEIINQKKKIVLLSPFTIPDVVHLIIKAGGTPVFFDFKKNSLDVSIDSILKMKKKYRNSIAAILITHYNYNQIDYRAIYLICKKYNFYLIEDCAISISGCSEKYRIGSLSDFSVYSFSSFKFLNYIWGGLIAYKTKYNLNFNKYKKWKKLNFFDYLSQLIKTLKFQILTNQFIFKYFTIKILRYRISKKQFLDKIPQESNLKLNNSYFTLPSNQAIYEIVRKVKFYNENLTHRRSISLIYHNFLKNISLSNHDNIRKRILESECGCYIILAKNSSHKSFLRKRLLECNFDVGKFYYNNCKQLKLFRNVDGHVPNLNSIIKKIVILPTHPRITEKYAESLSKNILKLY